MLIAAAVCPHPPVLIPAAMGEAGAGPELADLRAACAAAAQGLVRARPDLIVVAGGGPAGRTYPWPSAGSLHRYGVPWSTGPGRPVLPLSLTVGTWLLTGALAASGIPGPAVTSATSVMLRAVAVTASPESCRRLGARLAGLAPRVAMLAMGDASAKKAIGVPGAPDPEAEEYDAGVAAALAAADAAALARLDPDRAAELRVTGRAPWQVLAGAAAGQKDGLRGLLRHQAAPYDVSYLVASWAAEPDAAAVLAEAEGLAGWHTRQMPLPVITVVGATATGKSGLSLRLAAALNGEVVNADSMQLYRGMDIGTAKLTETERAGIPHHLLDVWDVTEAASVSEYQRLARRTIADIHARGRLPLLVGGSGLYIRAVIDELEFPGTDPAVRGRLEEELAAVGPAALHARLAAADPAGAAAILPGNGRRIVRALEVMELSGRPFSAELPGFASRYPVQQIGLTLPRAELDRRINRRVTGMWRDGLVGEVRALEGRGLAGRAHRQPRAGLRAGPEIPRRRVDRGAGRRGDREGHPPVRPAAGILVPPRSQDHLAPGRRPRRRIQGPGRPGGSLR